MFALLVSLLAVPALAETLDAPLGDEMGVVRVPSGKAITLSFKGATESDKASWENTDSDAVSMVCGAGKAPEDTFVEQLLVAVGEKKWALAPGASVKLSCKGDVPITVTDVHGTEVASFKGPMLVTVESFKSKGAR